MLLALWLVEAVLWTACAQSFNDSGGSNDSHDFATGEEVPDGSLAGICVFGSWGEWSACHCDDTGLGKATRERDVEWQSVLAGDDCHLLATQAKYCSAECLDSSVPCSWGAWSSWSECACSYAGTATHLRTRRVSQPASHGGTPCTGVDTEVAECDDSGACPTGYILFGCLGSVAFLATCSLVAWKCHRLRRSKAFRRVVDEEPDDDGGADGAWCETVPPYWANKGRPEGFHELVYVCPSLHSVFDDFLRATFLPRCTQDRPCPNGTCPKIPLGCPCVQPHGEPGLPVGFRVLRVLRMESSRKWRRYALRREAIAALRGEATPGFEPPLRGDAAISRHPEALGPLRGGGANEAYALHGTSVRSALSIAREDFRVDLAGSGAGSMYGAGCYLAESSTKADEYARDEPGGCYQGVFAAVLTRVAMGKFFYTTGRNSHAQLAVGTGEFDSTFGDRERSASTFRELVIYDTEQAYPEYVVIYRRVFKADDMAAVERACLRPLRLELPIYWSNCHRNLQKEAFDQQVRVRPSTVALLQRLVSKSSALSEWQILRARRVENAQLWQQYSSFKAGLRSRLEKRAACLGLAEDSAARGMLVSLFRSKAFAGHVLSMDHLDEDLCEGVLWHGTSKEAAEGIARDGFFIPPEGASDNRKRFGRGIYFAECLDKSLLYADAKGKVSVVLLCRVACGGCLRTSAEEDRSAHTRATAAGLDSVLAEPSNNAPRELVALCEEQVYPEYIVELIERPGASGAAPGADVTVAAITPRHWPPPPPGPPSPPPVIIGCWGVRGGEARHRVGPEPDSGALLGLPPAPPPAEATPAPPVTDGHSGAQAPSTGDAAESPLLPLSLAPPEAPPVQPAPAQPNFAEPTAQAIQAHASGDAEASPQSQPAPSPREQPQPPPLEPATAEPAPASDDAETLRATPLTPPPLEPSATPREAVKEVVHIPGTIATDG